MNYFLIMDKNRDGEHEYYDHVPVETEMTFEELDENKNFWEVCFLAWQFGWIEQDDDGWWWSDCRIVTIWNIQQLTKKEYDVISKYLGGFHLEQIIDDGGGDFQPNEKNMEKYANGAEQ
jgi:hypothetical protein